MTDARRSSEHYVVISADGHCGADLYEYKDYLPARFHDDFDRWAASYESPYDDLMHATAKRNWDSEFRLGEMDADGVAGEVLFPNTVPPFFTTVGTIGIGLPSTADEFEHRWAGLQAHNRWVLDFCARAPGRRKAVIQIFPNDIDIAVEEIRWAAKQPDVGAVLVPGVPPNHQVLPLYHRRYDPIWRECSNAGLAVEHHGGTGMPDYPWEEPASQILLMMEMGYWTRRTLTQLIIGGVFERFPDLKFAITELGGIGWALELAQQADGLLREIAGADDNRTYVLFGQEGVDALSMAPSDYMKRNVYHGASVLAPAEVHLRHEMGVDHIMWGSDYPHEEASSPNSREAIRWTFAGVPDDECAKMLGENAAKLFGFDLRALQPIADRVCPTVAEVHTPLPDQGGPAAWHPASRPFPGGRALART